MSSRYANLLIWVIVCNLVSNETKELKDFIKKTTYLTAKGKDILILILPSLQCFHKSFAVFSLISYLFGQRHKEPGLFLKRLQELRNSHLYLHIQNQFFHSPSLSYDILPLLKLNSSLFENKQLHFCLISFKYSSSYLAFLTLSGFFQGATSPGLKLTSLLRFRIGLLIRNN